MDDRQIIRLFFERSEQAITELSRKYGDLCFKVADNILNDPQDAEECVNDTYLRAWNAIPPEQPRSLAAFCCAIARNNALTRYQRDTAQKRNSHYDAALDELADTIPALGTTESEYEAKELSQAVNRFLGQLPKTDRYPPVLLWRQPA